MDRFLFSLLVWTIKKIKARNERRGLSVGATQEYVRDACGGAGIKVPSFSSAW